MPHVGELVMDAVKPSETVAFTPISGATLPGFTGRRNFIYDIGPAAALAALTVEVPAAGYAIANQVANFYFRKGVTAITWNGAATIRAPASVNDESWITLRRVAPGEWTQEVVT